MNYFLRTFSSYRKVETLDADAVQDRVAGTLGYTRGGLAAVVLLICLACIGFLAIQVVVPTLLPRQILNAGANNKTIALLITTIPYIIAMVINPIISFKSDRARTRIGRRMPFLLLSVPFVAIFCTLLGWTEWIGHGLDSILPNTWQGQGTLICLAVFSVVYNIFFLIPGSVFWYLFPDVIPQSFLGRFMSCYQLVSSLTMFVINRYFLRFADEYLEWLYTAVALLFLFSMMIMIFAVKEGDYEPAPDKNKDDSPVSAAVKSIKVYCRECYSTGFYYWLFVTMALSEISLICRNMYNFIYAQNVLKISTANFGEIMGWYGVVGMVLSLPFGYLCDKLCALKVYGCGLLLVIFVNLFSFYLVKDETTFFITTILLAVVYTVQMVASIPVMAMIFPKALYGQFCSANGLFRAFFMAIAGYGGGVLFDYIRNYQYIYLWDFLFTAAAFCTFIGLYVAWKRRGGKEHYIAPLSSTGR